MKFFVPLLISISALIATHVGATTADPFGGSAQSWTESIEAAKPLRLEICFGEINQTKSDKKNLDDDIVTHELTPEFFAGAETLRIAVAANDQGHIEAPSALTVIYRLTTKDHSQSLDLNFSLAADSHRKINTSGSIALDQWIVLGGLTKSEIKTVKKKTSETRKNLIIAVRLVSAKP
jgi:hypothetical protein